MASSIRGAGFTSNEVVELPEYRPVSRLAIAALAAGLLSATALTVPLLWVVPAVAAALSLVAIRHIDTSSLALSGRGLAVTAFCLALLFGSWSVSQYVSRYFVLTHRARAHSQDWLNLLRDGHLYEAHQLTLDYSQRAKPGESLQKIYSEKPAEPKKQASHDSDSASHGDEDLAPPEPTVAEMFAEWRVRGPVQLLASRAKKVETRFQSNVRIQRVGYGHLAFDQIYTLQYDQDGKPLSKTVAITVERSVLGGVAHWKVSGFDETTAPH